MISHSLTSIYELVLTGPTALQKSLPTLHLIPYPLLLITYTRESESELRWMAKKIQQRTRPRMVKLKPDSAALIHEVEVAVQSVAAAE